MRPLLAAFVLVMALTGSASAQGRGAAVGPEVTIQTPRVTGLMDRAIVLRVLRQRRAQLEHCYERARLGAPRLKGTMRATFRVGRVGTTALVRVEGVDNALENCVAGVVHRLRFPSGRGETAVEVAVVLRPPPPPPAPASALGSLLGTGCLCGLAGCTCPCACPCAGTGAGPMVPPTGLR